MSYGIMAFAFDPAKILRIRADPGWQERLAYRLKSKLVRLDDDFDRELKAKDALGHILRGDPFAQGEGVVYAYVTEILSDELGEFLPNSELMPCGSRGLDMLDAGSKALGLDELRASDLTYGRGWLKGAPPVDDFPGMGFHDWEACCRIDERLATFDPTPEELQAACPDDPQWLGDALRCVEGWFRRCADIGSGLATFYH